MPDVDNLKVGDVIVSMPVAFDATGLHGIGFSNAYPGGYAELMVINELMGIQVPDGLPTQLAAMTEPLAVGVHAVAKSRIIAGESAIVIGCGPVGLACIAELKLRGIGPVIAADFSPKRRALAEQLGADVVVDPARDHRDRCLARDRRRASTRDLRGRRRAGDDQRGDARRAAQYADPRGRRMHAGGPDVSRCSASGES